MSNQLRQEIDESPMGSFQWGAIAICVILNALDGFDVLVMAFTAAGVSAEWKLNGAQLGVLFSAGLLGMAAGSVLLAPMADRWGRQTITLLSLVLISAGMLLSGFSNSQYELAAMRALTGLGIGGLLASVTVIIGEYSSNKWRSTNIALYTAGYPLGATVGGLFASWLLTHYGWRSVFIAGGIATACMIPVVLWRLPESVDFLLARRPARALEKINRLLALMGRQPLNQMPAVVAAGGKQQRSISALFKGELARSTILTWSAFFLLMFSFYFALSWTPKLLVSAGLTATQGITGGVLLNLGGILGGVLFGLVAVRVRLAWLTGLCLLISSVFVAAFGWMAGTLTPAFVVAFGIGIFMFAAMAGLYGVTQAAYPAGVRTTGMGYAIGVGRLGAILAPLTAGVLLDGGWKPNALYYAFAVPLVFAAITMLAMSKKSAPTAGTQRDISGTAAAPN